MLNEPTRGNHSAFNIQHSTFSIFLFFVHKEHRHLADAAGTNDKGLFDVGAAARPRDDSHL